MFDDRTELQPIQNLKVARREITPAQPWFAARQCPASSSLRSPVRFRFFSMGRSVPKLKPKQPGEPNNRSLENPIFTPVKAQNHI